MAKDKKEPTRGSANRAGSRNVKPEDLQDATRPRPTDDCSFWETEGRINAQARQEELRRRSDG